MRAHEVPDLQHTHRSRKMTADESKVATDRRTEAAFARSPWQDPRADYRVMLRRLREDDPAVFETAVRDYEDAVVARLGDEALDPVEVWLSYGERLAALVGRGRLVRIDASGKASDAPTADPADPSPAACPLLLHLPALESTPAIVVAAPRDPSPAQRASLALLVEGRTAAPRS